MFMKYSILMKQLISAEYLAASVLTAIAFISLGRFDWWWLFVLFPIVDVSMFGYLQNTKAGALTYNIGHSLIGPAFLIWLFILQGYDWELFVGLVWFFHIFVDRTLGFGLKHTAGFEHTHLGIIGKGRKQ